MDKPEESATPAPIYCYTTTVWVEKTYTVIASDDETLEEAVCESLEDDGLDPEEFRLVRISWIRSPQHWH
jgi:hypothetical protein